MTRSPFPPLFFFSNRCCKKSSYVIAVLNLFPFFFFPFLFFLTTFHLFLFLFLLFSLLINGWQCSMRSIYFFFFLLLFHFGSGEHVRIFKNSDTRVCLYLDDESFIHCCHSKLIFFCFVFRTTRLLFIGIFGSYASFFVCLFLNASVAVICATVYMHISCSYT